jgi:hypothetical protein
MIILWLYATIKNTGVYTIADLITPSGLNIPALIPSPAQRKQRVA